MKTLSLLILLLTLVACGNASKTNSSSNSSQLSVNGLQLNTATIFIPAPDMVGGGSSIKINGTDYQIDTSNSDPRVGQYLTALYYGQVSVSPKSSTRNGKEYNAGYTGKLQQGACTFNPTATCTNAILNQLVVY